MKTFLLSLINHRKVGGLHFIRIGQISLSFCITQKHPSIIRTLLTPVNMVPEIFQVAQFIALL